MIDNTASIKDWARVQELAESGRSPNAVCILELRARLEALEANTTNWRCDHLRLANTCASLAPDRTKFFADLMPDGDVFELEVNSSAGFTSSNHPEKPDGSLVKRVSCAIDGRINPDQWLHQDAARAAIREVALWLNEAPLDLYPGDRGIVVNALYDQANQ